MPAETRIQTQAEVEEKMVDLPSEGESVDVEVKEAPKVVNSETDETIDVGEKEVVEVASETEVEDYSKKVQSRIDKLTKKLRESERREVAAIQYAQGVQGEISNLQKKTTGVDTAYIEEFGERVKAQTEEAKKSLKVALDTGDIDKQVDAQSRLSRLAIENERYEATRAKREQLAKAPPPPPKQFQTPQMPPPQPDPKAEEWAENNEWFGKDEPMTLTSFSIHRKLVEKGLDPSSNEYYNEIDKQMKENFPHKFGQQVSPTQTVASANRGGPIRRKGTVRLTPSQVAISKKLGVPLSEYAKYVKE